jgi:hypothetical protein
MWIQTLTITIMVPFAAKKWNNPHLLQDGTTAKLATEAMKR